MPLKSAPYYWLECDGCGQRAGYDEYSAWAEPGLAIDSAVDWTRKPGTEVFHCPACPPLDVEDEDEAVAS